MTPSSKRLPIVLRWADIENCVIPPEGSLRRPNGWFRRLNNKVIRIND
jgi:hypothetical protein